LADIFLEWVVLDQLSCICLSTVIDHLKTMGCVLSDKTFFCISASLLAMSMIYFISGAHVDNNWLLIIPVFSTYFRGY